MTCLRPALIQDIPALSALEERCFERDRFSLSQLRYLQARAQGEMWVLEEDGRIAAYAMLLLPARAASGRIYALAVLPEYRGGGRARRLIRHLEERCAKSGRPAVTLEVRQDNAAAMALYEDLGYRRLRALPEYYEDGAAGWKYRKELQA